MESMTCSVKHSQGNEKFEADANNLKKAVFNSFMEFYQ